MIRIRTADGTTLFTLSGTRLTQLDYNKKRYRPFRFLLLPELKTVLNGPSTPDGSGNGFEFGRINVTPAKSFDYVGGGDYIVRRGATQLFTTNNRDNPVDLSIGCIAFTKRVTNKILRAAGFQPAKKAKALSAAAGR